TQNGGEILRQGGTSNLSGVLLDGILNCEGNGTLAVSNGLTNDGTINLNTNGSAADAQLRFDDSTTLSGTGEVVLVRQGNDSRIETAPAVTMTAGADQWIHGAGQLNASLVNNGLIEADIDGFTMLVSVSDKTNNATMGARNNARMEIGSIAITQDPGAMLIADNGIIDFTGAPSVTSGILATANGGIIQRSGGTLTLDGITLMGALDVEGGGIISLVGDDFLNDGSMVLNSNGSSSDAILRFDADLIIDGAGEIVLNRAFNDAQVTSAAKVTGTIGASQTVRGLGTVSAEIVNHGLFSADSTAGALRLEQNVKTNNSIMRAEPGCVLEIVTTTIDQTGGGVISTDDGEVRLSSACTIVGGDLMTTSGGFFTRTAGTTILDGVTSNAAINIVGAGRIDITPAGLVNNGDIVVNSNGSASDAVVFAPEDCTISGSGRIIQNRGTTDSWINSSSGIITQAAGHTIEGAGTITGGFRNLGNILANSTITMNLSPTADLFVNQGLIEVSGAGGLSLTNGSNFDNQAMVTIATGSKMSVSSGYNQSAGMTTVNGELETVSGDINVTGGTIGGDGLVDAVLNIDGGTAAPGNSAGTLGVEGSYVQTASGTYEVEHNGTGPGEADRIAVTGTASLNGAVNVTLGYAPATLDSVNILTTTGAITGEFASLTAPDISPNVFYLVYSPGTVRLVATCVGDINGSGAVNFDDLNEMLEEWATAGTRGDVNGDGMVNFDDLNALLEEWGNTCP
ncbi:MAG: hypothetical protein KDA21_03535, partial [Phycisphaerales bacterium]|nr:hypothetical protein [Phycisphaerales bacterium]